MVEITGIGACVLDTLIQVSEYPKEDTKQKALERCIRGGGPVATGLVAASKLGRQTCYIGNLADDSDGNFLLQDFLRYGVDINLISQKPNCRSFASTILLNTETASRTCVFDRGTVPPLILSPAQLEALDKTKLLMVDGNELEAAVCAAQRVRHAGGKVLYDCGGAYEGVEKLLALTDIMIPSEEFALQHTGCSTPEDAAQKLWQMYSPEVIVITMGKKGGLLYQGESLQYYAAFPVEAVDTNGAGDVFHGAFAACVCKGYRYEECCLLASAASAIKCTGIGAREGTPDWETLVSFMKERT